MARPKKFEGTEVRYAMNGPDIEHDQLIGKIDKWNGEDRARASTAAETRGEIGQFTEMSGINPKALSFLRSIKKVAAREGGQAKAMDIIRSIEKGLPMVKDDIGGQQSEMTLAEPEAVDPAPMGKPSYEDDGHLDANVSNEVVNFSDVEIAGEVAAFENNLAEVMETGWKLLNDHPRA